MAALFQRAMEFLKILMVEVNTKTTRIIQSLFYPVQLEHL